MLATIFKNTDKGRRNNLEIFSYLVQMERQWRSIEINNLIQWFIVINTNSQMGASREFKETLSQGSNLAVERGGDDSNVKKDFSKDFDEALRS